MPSGDREAERRHFDRVVEESGDFNPFHERAWRELTAQFGRVAGRGASRLTVVEIGCGTGRSSVIYTGRAKRFIGLDLALNGLRLARTRFPALKWLQGDALQLPLGDATADVVAFSSVLHHLPDRLIALREASRVLRPGGLVFAFDPNLLHPPMALFRHPASPLYTSRGVSPLERPLLGRTLRQELATAGFIEVLQTARSGLPYRTVAPPLLNAGLFLYNACDRLLYISGLGRWFGAFLITAGRRPRKGPPPPLARSGNP